MDALSEDPKSHTLKVLSHNQYHTPTGLSPKDCPTSPIPLFEDWFKDAVARNVSEPEAITLATATSSGVPSARMVLFKAVDSTGFTFYTNYESRKSQEMEATGHAALVFYWREIHRSVRVVGSVEKVSKEESQKYFDSRPLGSKIGAWASPQSRVIGEGEIQNRVKEIEKQFGVNDAGERSGIPVPPYWGGWKVTPL
jgi:pyridoxamine-phosphate oxidase